MNKTKIKNSFVLLTISLLGIVFLSLSIKQMIQHASRDLDKTVQITGIVESTQIKTETVKVGVNPFILKKQKHLEIRLKSEKKSFGTYNPKQLYSEIQTELKPGKLISIHYYETKNTTNNIFQVESNNQLIINYKDYQKNERIADIIGILAGIMFLLVAFWLWKTKDLNRDWSNKYMVL